MVIRITYLEGGMMRTQNGRWGVGAHFVLLAIADSIFGPVLDADKKYQRWGGVDIL